jgi:hypothetical protein
MKILTSKMNEKVSDVMLALWKVVYCFWQDFYLCKRSPLESRWLVLRWERVVEFVIVAEDGSIKIKVRYDVEVESGLSFTWDGLGILI